MGVMELPPEIYEAVKVNAERDHFSELYEGFNNCPAADNAFLIEHGRPPGICDCGKAEAEIAWALIEGTT